MIRQVICEALGAFAWVAAVCGAFLVAGEGALTLPAILATAFCVGSVMAAFYGLLRRFSQAHFNPALSIAAYVAGRISLRRALAFTCAQTFGASLAALVFFLALSSTAGYMPIDFGANGFGSHSPGGYSPSAVFGIELVLTGLFALVYLHLSARADDKLWPPVLLGGVIAAFHIMSMPIDMTSLNPARSTAMALFAEGWAVDQLWVFWGATLAGGMLAGGLYEWLRKDAHLHD